MGSTPSSSTRTGRSTTATTAGPPSCWTTRCSRSRTTPTRERCRSSAFEQLAYATENGTWRSSYLAGAKELREGPFGTPVSAASGDLLGALTMPQVFDSLAVRLDGPRAWDHHLTICWEFTDDGAMYVTELRNGALNHRTAGTPPAGCTTFRLTRPALVGLVTGRLDLTAALGDGTVEVAGDAADLGRLVSLLAPVDPDFAIVTP